MVRRVLLVLLLLLQSLPLTVLAARHCRSCEHASEMKAGVHCPLRERPARTIRCHEHREPAGDRVRAADCTCGERAAAAIRKGDPWIPTLDVETSFSPTIEPLVLSLVARPADFVWIPPDPPPRPAILL